ncbi:RNB-domain-containing protein [Patellaria atrata CBS 101060]|uniref:RNB-domain-containing protein n=1 Tax=Patellaria atrata CBS 101060 TaxID=1346257 RepID=A0A9P4VPP4_9PEZI|nr:RNB-domain-containing protein [Patellaria atrata CBS 101060]
MSSNRVISPIITSTLFTLPESRICPQCRSKLRQHYWSIKGYRRRSRLSSPSIKAFGDAYSGNHKERQEHLQLSDDLSRISLPFIQNVEKRSERQVGKKDQQRDLLPRASALYITSTIRNRSSLAEWEISNQMYWSGQSAKKWKIVGIQRRPRRAFSRTVHRLASNHYRAIHSTTSSPPVAVEVFPSSLQLRRTSRLWHGQDAITIRERLALWQKENAQSNQNKSDPLGTDIFDSFTADTRSEEASAQIDDDYISDLEYELTSATKFEPGDLLELRVGIDRDTLLAIHIRILGEFKECLTITGKTVQYMYSDVHFTIKHFVDPAVVKRIIPHLPEEGFTKEVRVKSKYTDFSAPRTVTAPVVEKLVDLQNEIEEIYRKNASVLDNAHGILAHPTELRFGSLESIAQKLLGPTIRVLDYPTIFAVRKALLRAGYGISFDERSARNLAVYRIRPLIHVEGVDKVVQWIRSHQEYISATQSFGNRKIEISNYSGAKIIESFVSKARLLIEQSRLNRKPMNGGLGPIIPQTPTGDSIHSSQNVMISINNFSETDRLIIDFLTSWCIGDKFRYIGKLQSLGSMVLRAVGKYQGFVLDGSTACLFLQELGVISPFTNPIMFDENLLLPAARHSLQLEQLQSRVDNMAYQDDLSFNDSMSHLRKDWKDLDVYCIDGIGAEEIDDGISLERVPDSADVWVHIHVANPTAFFDRSHLLSRMAAHMAESIYFPEKTFPMLPKPVTANHFSLAPNRPVLTFSAKLNTKAEILKIGICPGIIRNVISLTPLNLGKLLGLPDAKGSQIKLTVGKGVLWNSDEVTTDHPHVDVSESQKKDLLTLLELVTRRYQRRSGGRALAQIIENTAEAFPYYNSTIGPNPQIMHTTKPRYQSGDPLIQLQAVAHKPWTDTMHLITSDLFVGELMGMCGEIGAKWTKDRNIPIIYRGGGTLTQVDEYWKYLDEITNLVNQKIEVPHYAQAHLLRIMGSAVESSTPVQNKTQGYPQYAKLTSPLRRYSDMIGHWQIEAALREEHARGHMFLGTTDNLGLPFTKSEIDSMIPRLNVKARRIKNASRLSRAFWRTQFFFRAHYFNQADLPAEYTAEVLKMSKDERSFWVWIREFSFPASMRLPSSGNVELGDLWSVKLVEINPYFREKTVEPVSLLRRQPDEVFSKLNPFQEIRW